MNAEVKADAFHQVLQKMGAGEKIDPKLWDQFVAAQNDGLKTGPKVGEKVPDFTLPDQNGKQWALQRSDGPQGFAAGLHPQRRLVTLLQIAARRAAGIPRRHSSATALTPPRSVTTRRKSLRALPRPIKSPIRCLSDKGSAVIRKFGILNTNVPTDVMFYGIPFPGDYLINPDGTVREKLFLPDYQERPAASQVVLKDFGSAIDDNGVTVTADDVEAKISLSGARNFSGNETRRVIDFTVGPGWHIYGQSAA